MKKYLSIVVLGVFSVFFSSCANTNNGSSIIGNDNMIINICCCGKKVCEKPKICKERKVCTTPVRKANPAPVVKKPCVQEKTSAKEVIKTVFVEPIEEISAYAINDMFDNYSSPPPAPCPREPVKRVCTELPRQPERVVVRRNPVQVHQRTVVQGYCPPQPRRVIVQNPCPPPRRPCY